MFENLILSLAVVFIVGFFLSKVISKSKIPPTTTYVILGVLFSPNLLGVISPRVMMASDAFSNIVLGVIAFTLGRSLSVDIFRRVGKVVTAISLSAAIVPWLLVTLVLWMVLGQPFFVALVFGSIAVATDPASTVAVVQEYKSKGSFTDTLLGVVAVDDLWALFIFGISFAFLQTSFLGAVEGSPAWGGVLFALAEAGGSLLAGLAIAYIFNFFLRFVSSNHDRLIYTTGFLFLAIGLAVLLGLSVLLTCLFFGSFFVNMNRANKYVYDTIAEIEAPLYLVFFVLAGAHMKFDMFLVAIYLIGAIFVLRALGKFIGAFLGARLVESPPEVRKYMGMALLPQAGIALGCALVVQHNLDNSWGDLILATTVGTTVLFELLGPLFTKTTLLKVKNMGQI